MVTSPTTGEVAPPTTKLKPEDKADSHYDVDNKKDAKESTDAPSIGKAPLLPKTKPTPGESYFKLAVASQIN